VVNLNRAFSKAKFDIVALRHAAMALGVKKEIPVPQPGRLLPWLLLGDLSDGYKLADGNLADLQISYVLLLCKLSLHRGEESLRKRLEVRDNDLVVVEAFDNDIFDIVYWCRNSIIKVADDVKARSTDRLLVNYYGGCESGWRCICYDIDTHAEDLCAGSCK